MKGRPPTIALTPRRGARSTEGDDDDRKRERDERMRQLEDNDQDTGESEIEREERHDRERARKKSKDEGDNDSDRDDGENPETRSARARERSRIAAILTSAPSHDYPLLAIHTALQADLPRTQAIALVREMGDASAVRPPSLATQILRAGARARGEVSAAPYRAPAQGGGHVATAQQIIAAGKKRRGEAQPDEPKDKSDVEN